MSWYTFTGRLVLCTLLSFSGHVSGQSPKVTSPTGSSVYVFTNSSFDLNCEVTPADGNTEVTWYRDDAVIDSSAGTNFLTNARIEGGVLKATLTKDKVQESDAGTYKCQIKGTDEHTLVEVKVSEIIVHDAIVKGPKNDTHITCEVQGSLAAGRYDLKWFRHGEEVTDKEDKYVLKPDNNTLIIQKVEFNDDLGDYECIFDLENGQDKINRTVTVYGAAFVKSFDKSKNLVEDDALNIECVASGYPLPTVAWYFEESQLNASDRVRFTSGDKSLVENTTLRIQSMQYEDAGDYTCEAVSVISGVTHSHNETITVRVKDKLAALWPFLGICVEVTILCIIIFIYEKRRQKRMAEEEAKEEASHLTNSHGNRDDLRQRKV